MFQLLYSEVFKLIRKSSTYYAIIALLIIESIVLLSAYYQGAGIIDVVLSNLKDVFYFEGELLNGNLIIYFILNSFWFHVPLLCMIVVSGMLTSEYEEKTIQTVMMQPVAKWKFLLSKYMIAILFTLILVFILVVTSCVLAYGIFGKGDLVVYNSGLIFFDHSEAFYRLLTAFLVGSITIVFYSVISLTLAVFFKDNFKTWIVAVLFLIVSTLLLKIDFDSLFFNKFSFFKLNNTWQLLFIDNIDWSTIFLNVFLLGIYVVIAILLGLIKFQKSDIG